MFYCTVFNVLLCQNNNVNKGLDYHISNNRQSRCRITSHSRWQSLVLASCRRSRVRSGLKSSTGEYPLSSVPCGRHRHAVVE